MNSAVESMHPDADRRLIVGKHQKATFAVCASAMSMASPVWNRMFKAPNADTACTWREPSLTELELIDDDPAAFRIVLMAVHYQFEELGQLAFNDLHNVECIASIAMLCDKYDTARLLKPWIQQWIASAIRGHRPSLAFLYNDTINWLNIAYVFNRKDILKTTIRCIGLNIEAAQETNPGSPSAKLQPPSWQSLLLKDAIPDITGELQNVEKSRLDTDLSRSQVNDNAIRNCPGAS
ncbi:MAG: hypothetical protein M1821_007517 [Bathelium mastoideum]|nr:MAG: hypothetical protein M1821_007517 [Bathelium mastoideum]